MQNRNFNSKRGKFNVSENVSRNGITQNNPTTSEYFASEKLHSYFSKNPETALKNGKSYSCMKIRASSSKENDPHTAHEIFLQVILTSAMIVAIVCVCLSIASMLMFFSI